MGCVGISILDTLQINISCFVHEFIYLLHLQHFLFAGLSNEARMNRKKKNIVSTKVNFIAWLFQLLSNLVYMVPFIPLHIRECVWRTINLAGPSLLYLYMSRKETTTVQQPRPVQWNRDRIFVIEENNNPTQELPNQTQT